MPVRHRELGDEIAPPEPKRCRHCDESRSSCGGGGGSEGPEGRASWRVTLDHDLVETLSAIYPEWFKPQHRRERSRAASPASPASTAPTSPGTPATSPNDDTFSSGAEEMASRQAGGGEPASSPPRVSPPKVVVDDSPLQPAMGKHKESLKVKLMMRRPINQLVAQGIMPPLKTPPAYFEQSKQLERAKTGDLLKAKIQRRPDRQELERRHILEQESHVDPSLAEKQRMLKKARLADALNDQLSHRPGPLELIKKNILHTEQDIETAVKSGTLAFRATSEGASGRPEHPSSYCGPDDSSPSPSPPCLLSPAPSPCPASTAAAAPVQHPAPGKADKNRKKTKHKQQQPKARFKFHEYKGPPNAHKAPSPPDSTETPYELLLQQQQLLLQLMPASPAPSSASVASDSSDAYSTAPPPPPPPPTPLHVTLHHLPTRYEDMKVSDLRAECKRRNLRVSGPKPQLISRLRPFLLEKGEEPPRSPASVASVASVASPESRSEPEPAEDIVQSQRRQIEELERKLEASRQQLEAVRREAAGAAASDQSRRLLQAHLCVTQLRAQLDALQQPPPAPAQPPPSAPAAPPAPRYVLAASDATPERLVRLFTVAQPAAADVVDPAAAKTANYILNGVKVVPIAILPSPHYEPERAAVPPPPPPPPPMPLPTLHDRNEDMDDVIELLVENGELPPSVVGAAENQPMRTEFLTDSADAFSPAEVLGDSRTRDSLAADELQRELNDIQNEIMNHADLHAVNGNRCDIDSTAADIDPELSVDLLTNNDFHPDFSSDPTSGDHDDFFGLLSGETDHADENSQTAMDIGEDPPERMAMTPLTNGDILDHTRTGFEDMDDLSLPSFQEDMIQERPCEFDLKEFGIDIGSNMTVDGDAYDYMDTELIPNLFGRGHVPQRDPLLGAVLSRPPPRPARKHYSWDRIEYDAT